MNLNFTLEIETTAPRAMVEHLMITAVKSIAELIYPEGTGDVTITLRDPERMLAMMNLTSDTAADLATVDLTRDTVADLLAMDRQTWPQGHPCRSCGRLYTEHPTPACEAWY